MIFALLGSLAFGIPSSAAAPVNAPVITGTTPTSPANNNNPVVDGTTTTTDPNAVVAIYADVCSGTPLATGPAATGAFHVAVPVADDTTTNFVATVTDGPHVSPCSTPPVTYVEASPPETTIAPASPVTGPDTSFSFAGDDGTGSGVAGFECRLETDLSFGPCTTPKNYSNLPAGVHTFFVRAIDKTGYTDPTPASWTWTVDTVSPNVTFTAKPPALTNQRTANFAFSADKDGSSFECSLDGAPFTACSSPKVYTGLGNGEHTVAVHALWLGLIGPPSQYAWRVDLIAPQTTIRSGPPIASTTAAATFTYVASEQSTFTCRLDGAGPVPCTSPKVYTGLGDGAHTFSVQAVDRAGNVDSTPASYAWRISGVGPPVQDLRPPANVARIQRNVGYRVLQLRWRRPREADFDHVAVFVSTKKGVAPRTLVYSGKRQSYVKRRFANGLYYRYLVVSYDTSDNASGGRSTVIPPSALLRSPRNGRVVRSAPLLQWAPVRRATFYNVQLYYHGGKVLSVWPLRARQALKRHWSYSGRPHGLRKGVYSWFVWPGFGPRAKSRYGSLLGQGTFRVR
ncbi:MAG: hypothetical protein ACJ75Q_07065 [Gaiellaceae bacterium]